MEATSTSTSTSPWDGSDLDLALPPMTPPRPATSPRLDLDLDLNPIDLTAVGLASNDNMDGDGGLEADALPPTTIWKGSVVAMALLCTLPSAVFTTISACVTEPALPPATTPWDGDGGGGMVAIALAPTMA
jgi:hypothetical protein